ncbi:MAG: ABC-three component system middle component 6 [Dolichospermum sp.]
MATFERFVLTLDLLYAIGAIDMEMGLLRRCHR